MGQSEKASGRVGESKQGVSAVEEMNTLAPRIRAANARKVAPERSEFVSRKAAIEIVKENAKALGPRKDSHLADAALQFIVAIDAARKGNAS